MVFVGTKVEGVVGIVLVAFWTAIVAIGTDAGDGLAVPEDASNQVQNANLYYFSWAGFVTSIIIMAKFLQDAFGIDMVGQLRSRAARIQWWAAFLAASIVVMGSAARSLRKDCGEDSEGGFSDSYCRKAKFAVSAGAIGSILSLLVIASKVVQYTATEAATPFLLEMFGSGFMTILNGFAVAYTTSADAPGSGIGNLYYFSWATFLIAAVVGVECYTEFVNPVAVQEGAPQNGTRPDNGDLVVEEFDDGI